MLWQRTLTALILVPPLLLAVIYMETLLLAMILGIIICLAAWEWTTFAELKKNSYKIVYLIVVLILLIGGYLLRSSNWSLIIIYLGVSWWLFALGLIIAVERKQYILSNSCFLRLLMGLLVLVPAWFSLILIHASPAHLSLNPLIFLFILVWTADISGYFFGKKFGNRRLSPQISPGKTWEGVYGALIACLFLGLGYGIKLDLQLYDIIIFVLICSVTVTISIIGDLLESLMKRSVNLKNTGNILPGHGGVLDRIDSLTAAGPFYFAALTLQGNVI